MTDTRRHRASYHLRRRRAALAVLANPNASDKQRHHARCRLNRALDVLARLAPIAPMRCGLAVDRQSASQRALIQSGLG